MQEVFERTKHYIQDLLFSPHPEPQRDWFFILSFFATLFLIFFVISTTLFFYYDLYEHSDGTYTGDPDEQSTVAFDEDDLLRVWDFFEEKERRFTTLSEEGWEFDEPTVEELEADPEEGGEEIDIMGDEIEDMDL